MLNTEGQRELVYGVKVDAIHEIPGADKVEVAEVGGWRIMVRKRQFKPGDIAIYFEIDSKVPEEEPFMFLEPKHFKIKTQKYFKGTVISQGLLMSEEDFGWEKGTVKEGEFLTTKLKVTYEDAADNTRKAKSKSKYDKMADRHKKLFKHKFIQWLFKRKWGKKLLFRFLGKKTDKLEWPDWVRKTDEERVQNMTWILKDKSPWVATEKVDGTSTTATVRKFKKEIKYFVCSRNVVFVKDNSGKWLVNNDYTEIADKYGMDDILMVLLDRYNLEWVTLQGETYGGDIQKRKYTSGEHKFVGFNLIFSDRGRLGTLESAEIMKEFGIEWVPVVDEAYILPDTIEEILAYAEGTSAIDGKEREGIVFRSPDGQRSFKAVSNSFLLKYHG